MQLHRLPMAICGSVRNSACFASTVFVRFAGRLEAGNSPVISS
jgi:hypothetical protein